MVREYLDGLIKINTKDILDLKTSTDRGFINKMLEKVFTKNELYESSAQGKVSHGKKHKQLCPIRLKFVQSEAYFIKLPKCFDLNPF